MENTSWSELEILMWEYRSEFSGETNPGYFPHSYFFPISIIIWPNLTFYEKNYQQFQTICPKITIKMANVELGSHRTSDERYRKWNRARKRY